MSLSVRIRRYCCLLDFIAFAAVAVQLITVQGAHAGSVSLEDYSVPVAVVKDLNQRLNSVAFPVLEGESNRNLAVVEITFTAGTMGDNMMVALQTIADDESVSLLFERLPSSLAHLDRGECEAFAVAPRLWPRPDICTAGLGLAVRRLSDGVRRAILQSASGLTASDYYVPLIIYRETTEARGYGGYSEEGAGQIAQIDKNWSPYIVSKGCITLDGSAGGCSPGKSIILREVLSVKWYVPIIVYDDEDIDFLAFELSEIPNVTSSISFIDKRNDRNRPAVLHTASVFEAYNSCNDENSGIEGDYASLIPSLYDTKEQVKCQADLHSEFPIRISIIDTGVQPNPEVSDALSICNPAPSSEDCNEPTLLLKAMSMCSVLPPKSACSAGSYSEDRDHGTFLAGIVASAKNGRLFTGIAENIPLQSIQYVKGGIANDKTDSALANFINSQSVEALSGAVFLFAAEFGKFKREGKPERLKSIWSISAGKPTNLFASARVRFANLANQAIKAKRPLMVVAAGQVDAGEGDSISAKIDRAPQNLGDQDNVVVVAACEDCNGTATLWPQSNYSESRKFVHIAAPGADAIPGIIDSSSVAQIGGGTSSAAAFAAGVAGNMMACYPNVYRFRPHLVKQWLMISSRPIVDEASAARIAGGNLDPGVAMLNPESNWIKAPGKSVQQVDRAEWCMSTLPLKDIEDSPSTIRIRRVTHTIDSSQVIVTSSWLANGIDNENLKFRRYEPAEVDSNGPLLAIRSPSNSDTLCTVDAQDFEDLIVRDSTKTYAGDCLKLPRCSQL